MTHDSQLLRSRADVSTPRGERWIKQLTSHLGSKAELLLEAEVLHDASSTTLRLAGGTCSMTSDAATLHFVATGPDEATLKRLQELVGNHLERFAAKDQLHVVWKRE